MPVVLADTSVWVAHFRRTNPALQALLARDQIICHPLIILELACGTPPSPRERTLGDLQKLRRATIATPEETLALIAENRLFDSGCGAVDMLILASVLLTGHAALWTLDKPLATLASGLGVQFNAEMF